MIPFNRQPTRTLAPATGWASVNPWASFHQSPTTPDTAKVSETAAPAASGSDPQGCCAASWAY
jgi:hypothetical protein